MHTTIDLKHTPGEGGSSMKFRYEPESKPLDGYTIKRAIQRGGFGEVYYALSDAGKEVALKLLRDNMEVELRGVAQCLNLKHPNLITIFDVKKDKAGDHWVVMEFVSGKGLDQIIADHPNGMPHEKVSKLLEGIAAGVDYLHNSGVVHRDIKPANIYTENDFVKIGDIGLAKFISVSRRSAHTQSVGTVYYMAPEIAHGRYGKEVDVYAVAVMLFEMLTGKVPFDGETTGEILMKQLSESPDLSLLPDKIQPVLRRGLEKDPIKRTPTVQKLKEEFDAALLGRNVANVNRAEPLLTIDEGPKQEQLLEEVGGLGRRTRERARRAYRYGRRMNRGSSHRSTYRDDDLPWIQRPDSWWKIGLGVLLAFILIPFAPALALVSIPIVGVAAMAALGYGTFTLIAKAFRTEPPGGHGVAMHRDRRPSAVKTNSSYVRYESPATLRHVSMLRRSAELSGSMSVSALCAALIAGAMWGTQALIRNEAEAVLFGAVTMLGAWAAMLPAKMWEGRGTDGVVRRVLTGLFGGLVGVGAWFLDKSLLVGLETNVDGSFSQWLAGNDRLPVSFSQADAEQCLGYVLFFGILMLLRRWWFHVDSYRPSRIRISSIGVTALVGLLLSAMGQFPPEWAVSWAVAISATSQIASVWVHPDQRGAVEKPVAPSTAA